MLYELLLLLGICALLGEIIFLWLWIGGEWKSQKKPIPSYSPKTCVIVPCKGTTNDFNENVKAICNQNYNHYSVVFVIDSKQDPAYTSLQDLCKTTTNSTIKITDRNPTCSGKIAALLTGIKTAGDLDVYVFADSDIRPHSEWLRYLVSYLNQDTIGVTTGYRWYFPSDFKSSLLSTWNLAGISFLGHPRLNYTWGGSTAIKKHLFDTLDIKQQWAQGFSDDLILTKCVKNAGYMVKFIPQCIVESYDDAKIRTFLQWGTTQYTWVKWYYPSLWFLSCIGLVGLKVVTLLGIVLISVGLLLPGLIMVSTIVFEICFGLLGFRQCKKIMIYPPQRIGTSLKYGLIMPLVFFLISYNFITSFFKKTIVWKDQCYKKKDIHL
jgi:cellulose synthase/poly-beta-1,6-N-acetylglucosamine synthase-like glycosyltransferase